ncbi:TetR/AcrR family transcriptional regulator [Roseiterribacter gracilis]|uniref:TetR family transcriptional regulator n=1 Tax=Roseiterribacter gracilis TaxID=2812848 RepID=A0A8S8X5X9_9PROT|nr:TetR family transcriptional regulator [Rhodospirillales bacterium TMPK1]
MATKKAATKKTASRAPASRTPVSHAKGKAKKTLPSLTREDWLQAAKSALLKGGVDRVKVDRLARDIKMTRGSFYWHFTDRADLLAALLEHWEATNTGPLLRAFEEAARHDKSHFHDVAKMWIAEKEYSPAFDTAIRDWARKDAAVAKAVRRVDEKRIDALTKMMKAYGFKGEEAFIRARVIYFHQIGYYTLAIRESEAERIRLEPIYAKVLLNL